MRPGGLRVHVGGARGAGERARPQALHGLVQRGHGAGGDARHVNPSAGVLVDADAALAAAGLRGGGGMSYGVHPGAGDGGRGARRTLVFYVFRVHLVLFAVIPSTLFGYYEV